MYIGEEGNVAKWWVGGMQAEYLRTAKNWEYYISRI